MRKGFNLARLLTVLQNAGRKETIALNADIKRRMQAHEKSLARTGVRSFLPLGKSAAVIYAVTLHCHPGVVKVGMSAKWRCRRKQYANWNLANGDAINQEVVFLINEEYVDLRALECEILLRAPWPKKSGNEWFIADLGDVCRLIDEVMCEGGITYSEF